MEFEGAILLLSACVAGILQVFRLKDGGNCKISEKSSDLL